MSEIEAMLNIADMECVGDVLRGAIAEDIGDAILQEVVSPEPISVEGAL